MVLQRWRDAHTFSLSITSVVSSWPIFVSIENHSPYGFPSFKISNCSRLNSLTFKVDLKLVSSATFPTNVLDDCSSSKWYSMSSAMTRPEQKNKMIQETSVISILNDSQHCWFLKIKVYF
jgi:hypothetical protein